MQLKNYMDRGNFIFTIQGKINSLYPVIISCILNSEIYKLTINKYSNQLFSKSHDLSRIEGEISVDQFLSEIVLNNAFSGALAIAASIDFRNKSLLSTGGIIGSPASNLIFEQIHSGKIYKTKENIYCFGYPGEFGIITEGSYKSTFILRERIEDNSSLKDIEYLISNQLFNFKRVIICYDGTNNKTEKAITTFDFDKKEIISYSLKD